MRLSVISKLIKTTIQMKRRNNQRTRQKKSELNTDARLKTPKGEKTHYATLSCTTEAKKGKHIQPVYNAR